MKTIKGLRFFIFFLAFASGCKTKTMFIAEDFEEGYIHEHFARVYINSPYYFKDTNLEKLTVTQDLILNKYTDKIDRYLDFQDREYFGKRRGRIVGGKQFGLWQSKRDGYVFREEYFKMGLRDSIYRIYNEAGDTLYSTYFNMGTGIEKDFHPNGQLYYEVETKDGYFTDILKIYDKKGFLTEVLLFEKDSVAFYQYISQQYNDESELEVYRSKSKYSAKVYINGLYFKNFFPEYNKGRHPVIEYISSKTLTNIRPHKSMYYWDKHFPKGLYWIKYGYVIDGKQDGCWMSMFIDPYQNNTALQQQDTLMVKISGEEYFKMGLRDSVYRIYNATGDTIYSTYFHMGTGVEKQFHQNGSLYYKIEMKDGYFTDTLRIYNDEGRIVEKLFFNNDLLVFYQQTKNPTSNRHNYQQNVRDTMLSVKSKTPVNSTDRRLLLLNNEKAYISGYYSDIFDGGYLRQELTRIPYFIKSEDYSTEKIHGIREGHIYNKKPHGYWLTKRPDNGIIFREEHFNMGVRDSIYRIYDNDGKVLYSTCFRNGNGVEKDFHDNGQLYYEIEMKDGFFTDTLRIYDKQGRVSEKLYFEMDSLVYYKYFSYPN